MTASSDRPANGGSDFRRTAERLQADITMRLRDMADDGKARAGAAIEGLAQAAEEFAARLGDASPVAAPLRNTAETLGQWSQAIGDKSVDDLLDDSRTLVRRSPAVAVGVALIAGFALSRLLKASDPPPRRIQGRDA